MGQNPTGEMPVDISSFNNIQSITNNNITKNNIEQLDIIPVLDLCQSPRNDNDKNNKIETNILIDNEIQKIEKSKEKENIKNIKHFTTKERFKTINLFEYIPKKNDPETVEHYLNIILKNIRSNSSNKTLFCPSININPKNNAGKRNTFVALSGITNHIDVDKNPFIVSDYNLISKDETNITTILRANEYFQEQNQNIINLIITELTYLKIPSNIKIYDVNDSSNFYYIIKKGSISLVRDNNIHENGKEKKNSNEKITKNLGPWEGFGEISFFSGRQRDEVAISNEDCELYLVDSESCRDIINRNNGMVLNEKYNFLNNISIFEPLDKISKYNVAQKLKKKEFEQNEKIISRGEEGGTLYIIKEGIVSCKIGVKEIRKLSNNEYFGENTLLIESKRGADIITLQRCICYELTKADLKDALSDDYIEVILYCFFQSCINSNNGYLKQIIIDSLNYQIFKCFSLKQYAKRELIFNKKSPDELKRESKRLIIVVSGSIYSNSKMQYEKGHIIGEEIFQDYLNKNISEDLIAYPDCITLEANIEQLAKVMKIDLNKEKSYNVLRYINKLKKSYLFKNLSENTLELIAKNMKKEKFNKGDIIIKEGSSGETFYLISKGKVNITKDGKFLRVLDAGECLGEKSLISNDSIRTATATADDKVICYVIYKKEFDMILKDENTREYLLKKLVFQNTDIQLNDLYYLKFLGKGKFGSVSLVHNKKNLYAIKAISIKMVEREKMLWKYFVNERNIMLSLDHPFIVKMVKSLRNKDYCFILMEYINQVNLDEHLSKRKNKNNAYETQFYVGSILLMLEYLQKKYIAHRDIKPSNIMIDDNGYLKMIDFGTAKILKDYTSTIIGTPHYIAPEILQGKGYSLSCDFWSLGICMYEIFYGIYPFGNNAHEVIDIYREILRKALNFPRDSMKYSNINSFIKNLLSKKVNERVCNVSKLKHKPFFEGFEFDKLNDFQLEPPFIPEKKSNKPLLKEVGQLYEDIFSNEKESTICYNKKHGLSKDEDSDYNVNWVENF